MLNNINFKLMYLNNNIININDYADELFKIMKEHYTQKNIVTELGIKPIICDNNKSIICSWA